MAIASVPTHCCHKLLGGRIESAVVQGTVMTNLIMLNGVAADTIVCIIPEHAHNRLMGTHGDGHGFWHLLFVYLYPI